uniref:Interleukin 10 receptor subunit beta n=1 Tax=Gadus morhua TaxID=8049 RepID=A0A8C5BTA2_GADMO
PSAVVLVLITTPLPLNARLTSWNMDLVLRWDSPGDPAVHYTAEFNSTVFKFRPGCVNTSALYCDFTDEASSLTVYGTYIGRVRAQRGQESSVWVESGPLTLDKNTTIGPPNVTLVSHGVHMTINIRDPVFRISKMREVYNQASYNITYWKEGKEDEIVVVFETGARVLLRAYCVVVQRVNAPTQLDESMSMQVNGAFPLRHNYQTKHPSHSPSEHYESKMHISR